MSWLSRLFADDVGRLDGNRLTDFETCAYEQVSVQSHPSVAFVSLRFQLLEWLRVRMVGRVGGMPDWWTRTTTVDGMHMTQSRIVGGDYSLPKACGPVEIGFNATVDGDSARLVFTIDEAVQSVTLALPKRSSKGFPDPESLHVAPAMLEDERPYWRDRAHRFEDLRRVSEVVLEQLDPGPSALPRRFALPASHGVEHGRIEGVSVRDAYARLLEYANGMRIDRLSIWGCDGGWNRLFEHAEQSWLYVGQIRDDLLALRVADGETTDELVKVLAGSGRLVRQRRNVIELCIEAIQR